MDSNCICIRSIMRSFWLPSGFGDIPTLSYTNRFNAKILNSKSNKTGVLIEHQIRITNGIIGCIIMATIPRSSSSAQAQ